MSETETQQSVRSLYERRPYPPPPKDIDVYRDRRMVPRGVPSSCYHHIWLNEPARDDLDILVAGCGTSQAVEYALWEPKARIVAIDLSQSSLDHTQWLADKYDVKNIELHRMPIDEVATLDRQFDYVACTGVLHHLKDPDAGLRTLRDVLRPNGSIYVMVYGKYGRLGVYMLQDYCKQLGLENIDSDLEDFGAVLKQLPDGHPMIPMIKRSPDVSSFGGLADMFLHPQDRAYTVPEIYDWLERNDMTFQRWLHQATYLPQCCRLAQTPHLQRIAELPEAQQHAVTELFRGHIHKHYFIACRNDRAKETWRVDWEDRWRELTPITLATAAPRKITHVRGAVAELIHSAHEYPVLHPYLTRDNLPLYQLMDGKRTLGEIADQCGLEGAAEKTRQFFRHLWDFDQIMMRASG